MVVMLVIGTIIAFILADAIVQWVECKRRQSIIYLHSGHTQLSLQGLDLVRVGIDDFMRNFLGTIDSVESLKEGEKVRCGETLFIIYQGHRKIRFRSPVDGIVSSVSPGEGWVCTISPTNLTQNLKGFRVGEEAVKWLQEEVRNLYTFLTSQPSLLGNTALDGGQIIEGVLQQVDDETWKQFESMFINRE